MDGKLNVYVDDQRRCPDGFTLARSAEECLLLLESYAVHILSLDHDLGWGEPTGFDIVRHMVDRGWYPDHIYLHTSSVVGRFNMYQLLYASKPEHVALHNGPIPDALLLELAQVRSGSKQERLPGSDDFGRG
ncbi:cell division protein FtsJ [Xylanibacillus composti]|uniref:Cyclic-phosphate processing Receiver domain-containing protein n=1 Tax=Xylanibacillus composti TaxID=1572762 RepID=A0A8J4H3I2_9BACL|nr:cyclic-phosphate processing receiver domain-containing protein [Xylanibacillus composti]MDT9724238.1 cell division protein FtsJ [Xylanibacillus composti]GIQ68244.1 hypothetical protein XYCOK13_10680 [Xylanibacillus composti]